jgi:hypothetical protein
MVLALAAALWPVLTACARDFTPLPLRDPIHLLRRMIEGDMFDFHLDWPTNLYTTLTNLPITGSTSGSGIQVDRKPSMPYVHEAEDADHPYAASYATATAAADAEDDEECKTRDIDDQPASKQRKSAHATAPRRATLICVGEE